MLPFLCDDVVELAEVYPFPFDVMPLLPPKELKEVAEERVGLQTVELDQIIGVTGTGVSHRERTVKSIRVVRRVVAATTVTICRWITKGSDVFRQ